MSSFDVTMEDIIRTGPQRGDVTNELLTRLAKGDEPTTGWMAYLHALAQEVARNRAVQATITDERLEELARGGARHAGNCGAYLQVMAVELLERRGVRRP